jgi:S-adenosylmethionine hydrolase
MRSNNSFIKKQKADKRAKKRKEKFQKRINKEKNPQSGNFENMIAYVDKFGNITSEPPMDSDTIIKKQV